MNRDEFDDREAASHHLRRRPHRLKAIILDLFVVPRIYVVSALLILAFFVGYFVHDQTKYPALTINQSHDVAAGETDHNYFSTACAAPLQPEEVRHAIINHVYNGTSPWDGFPPSHAKPFLLDTFTPGWGSQGAVFEHMMSLVRPKVIIEVGTYLGASALHMAGLAKKLGLEGTQIICVDDFRGWPGHADAGKGMRLVNGDTMMLYQFMQNVMHAKETEKILFMPFSTVTALNGLCAWGVYGDLVEIDADHDFHSAWVDINIGYKVLKKPGGVLFGHDYAWDGVRKAVHLFAGLHGMRVKRDGEHWILY